MIVVTDFRRRQWHPTPVLLPGKSHGRRNLVGCSPWGHEESDTTERLHFFSLSRIGEGNGNPLQCSCLENPRDGGAWWAAVYGVAQSWTQLKWLSSSSRQLKWMNLALSLWEEAGACAPLNSLLWYALQLSGASILCFPHPNPLRVHSQGQLRLLRAWQPLGLFGAHLGASHSGLMAATPFVFWCGKLRFSSTIRTGSLAQD